MKKTGYDWCVDANLRILDLINWDTEMADCDESYFTELIDVQEFYRRLALCRVKANSMPRKTDLFLEYRMYGFTPYQLLGIQKGIQFGHAVVDYGRMVEKSGDKKAKAIYDKFADSDKTFIVLDGGSTNTNPERLGTLNQLMNEALENDVLLQAFYEPDLGDQLTGFVFLVDERAYDKKKYPSFVGTPFPWPLNKKPSEKEYSKWEAENAKNYASWEEKIGGPKNAFLRTFLEGKRLAMG